jgi:hypothetical protein
VRWLFANADHSILDECEAELKETCAECQGDR